MIGVLADACEHEVVREFFELFKTPWEFHQAGRRYDVIISTNGDVHAAKVCVLYCGKELQFDDGEKVETHAANTNATLLPGGQRLPLYSQSVSFPEKPVSHLIEEESRQCAAHVCQSEGGCVVRVGYDLFVEVRILLSAGQPRVNASIPALDQHIALLRDLITAHGVDLVEIPPIPKGFRFVACLTHDVDHPAIRLHRWDHTTLGFLSRSLAGSVYNFIRRRISLRTLATNWFAALKLPLVHLGLVKDFWQDFDDRYLRIEKGLPSTFFILPFKDHAGQTRGGDAPRRRAARYGARDVTGAIAKLVEAGCEIGLHGIDAWIDSSKGFKELKEIRELTSHTETGVRMHWLYSDSETPSRLERAGAHYDSTVGYNDTVGYRAGTTQVYKPLSATTLLELPLHAMDTALFYPAYLGLAPWEAIAVLTRIVENTAQFGGCVTINWHDRSLAPERMWDSCYQDLLETLKRREAWFATAGEAVRWFRKRRSVIFEGENSPEAAFGQAERNHDDDRLPGLRLQIHRGRYIPEACANRICSIGSIVKATAE